MGTTLRFTKRAPKSSQRCAPADRSNGESGRRERASVCWVLITTTHYHVARMRAFAAVWPGPSWILELTSANTFSELEVPTCNAGFRRHTLMGRVPPEKISPRAVVAPLLQALSKMQPDVVCLNGWSLPGSLEALWWCLKTETPCVLMSESTEDDAPRRPWREFVKGRVVRLASAALVGGQPHRRYLEKFGFPNVRVFPGYDVVDNEYFAAGADQARCEAAKWRRQLDVPDRFFLASARFERKKNLGRLLQAFATYRRWAAEAPWDLVILGDGELREELQAQRSALGLGRVVLMPGFRGYSELPRYYGLASAFVHASNTEQWGLVVNEAMAAGLPVLVSNRCGCAPDLVEEGRNGFTFDPYDVEGLARLMLCMSTMSDAERAAMGQASREIISRWTPETFATNLMKAVEVALAAPRPKATLLDKFLLWALVHRPRALR
jgi:glycosyltransferase involved in cell wall biosynthesis